MCPKVVVAHGSDPRWYGDASSKKDGTTSPVFSDGPKTAGCPEDALCLVKAWGDSDEGGSGVPSDISNSGASGFAGPVVSVASTYSAFAAVLADGSVRAWGRSSYGGSGAPLLPQQSSQGSVSTVSISSTTYAMAALVAYRWQTGAYLGTLQNVCFLDKDVAPLSSFTFLAFYPPLPLLFSIQMPTRPSRYVQQARHPMDHLQQLVYHHVPCHVPRVKASPQARASTAPRAGTVMVIV